MAKYKILWTSTVYKTTIRAKSVIDARKKFANTEEGKTANLKDIYVIVKNPRGVSPLIKRSPKASEVSEIAYMVKDLVTEQDIAGLRPYLGTEFVSRRLREIADRRGLRHNLEVHSALIELTPFRLKTTMAYGR